jgi:hypothetical protein
MLMQSSLAHKISLNMDSLLFIVLLISLILSILNDFDNLSPFSTRMARKEWYIEN